MSAHVEMAAHAVSIGYNALKKELHDGHQMHSNMSTEYPAGFVLLHTKSYH